MNPIQFIPIILASLGLTITAFNKNIKNKRMWLVVAFIIWLVAFVLTFMVMK